MPADLPPFTNLRDALKDLEKCITCAYCSRIYTDPFTLTTCGHTFCENCVLIFVSAGKTQSLCPLCNIPIWLNQSQTNRQLKGLLQHYKQIRSLLGIDEPINTSPTYLKPKHDNKRRKGRKKTEKLFNNPKTDVSPSSQSLVQSEDMTLEKDTRSLVNNEKNQTTDNVDPTCNINPLNVVNPEQEPIISEAKSNSDLVGHISPASSQQGMVTSALTNPITKMCDGVIPIQEIDNSKKFTSTPANGEFVGRDTFLASSKSAILPRNINFFQLIDEEDSMQLAEKSLKQDSTLCHQQVAASPIISHTEQQGYSINTQYPGFQKIDASSITLSQSHTPVNTPDLHKQKDSCLDTYPPVIQQIDPSTIPRVLENTPVQTQKSQEHAFNSQSPVIQHNSSSITPPIHENTPTSLGNSQGRMSSTNIQYTGFQKIDTSIITLNQRHTSIDPSDLRKQDYSPQTQSPVNQPIGVSPINPLILKQDPTTLDISEERVSNAYISSQGLPSDSKKQDSCPQTQSPVINTSPINALMKKQTPIGLDISKEQSSNTNSQSSAVQKTGENLSPINLPELPKQDPRLKTQSPVTEKSDSFSINSPNQKNTLVGLHDLQEYICNISSQSTIFQQKDTLTIPLALKQTPDNYHKQVSSIKGQCPGYRRIEVSPISLSQWRTPIKMTSQNQDSCSKYRSPVIENIDESPVIHLSPKHSPTNTHTSHKQDANINIQSPVIQQIVTSPINLLTHEDTAITLQSSQDKIYNLIPQSPAKDQQANISMVNLDSVSVENQVEDSQSLDDSVIIESVYLPSNSPTIDVCDKSTDKLQPSTHTKPPSTKTGFLRENSIHVYSNAMCISQPLPYDHILQAQENHSKIPKIQLFNPETGYPPYSLMNFQTGTNNVVYYYPRQVPIKPRNEFVPSHKSSQKRAPPQNYSPSSPVIQFDHHDDSTLSLQNSRPNSPINHLDIINPVQKKRDTQAAQHQSLQHDLEMEQKRLDGVQESNDFIQQSPNSQQSIEQTSLIERELITQFIDTSPFKNEETRISDSQELKEDKKVTENIETKGVSLSDCFLRKYSIQLSPSCYTQNSQMNEVLSVVKDLSSKISRLDSDEDSNFSLSHQSPRFMRNSSMAKSPLNYVNRLHNIPIAKLSPGSRYAERNFASPRVSTMESYNSEMTIDSSLNIFDYADMSIDDSLYKEKHFSPSLTSPIPSKQIKRRSNGFKSKKIKLSAGGIYHKPNKDSRSNSSRVLSPIKGNEINQLPRPQGRTRSRRRRYPQVS